MYCKQKNNNTMTSTSSNSSQMTLLEFFSLTSSLLLCVYIYSAFAVSGFSLVFFIFSAVLLYFIPTALVSGELATVTTWGSGGVYSWCSLALGKRWGFFAVFLQWFQITVGFIAMLYFMVGSLSHILEISSINSDPYLKFTFILIVFWAITLLSLAGPQIANKIADFGTVYGIMIPIIVLICLASIYVATGHTININFSWKSFFPKSLNIADLSIFVTFLLVYTGIEVSATNVNKLANPKKSYPIALCLIIAAAVLAAVLTSLSIAIVIPGKKIAISEGFLQTYVTLLKIYNMEWVLPIAGVLIMIGVIAKMISWVSGPSDGMLEAAKEKLLPDCFSKVNKNGTPYFFIIVQAILVSFWCGVITLGVQGKNLPYILAMSLTSIIYLAMYVVLFISYLVLKKSHPNDERAFSVPGGKVGQYVIPVIGLITVCFAIVASFFAPSEIKSEHVDHTYEVVLITSFVLILLLPNVIYSCRKKYLPSSSIGS